MAEHSVFEVIVKPSYKCWLIGDDAAGIANFLKYQQINQYMYIKTIAVSEQPNTVRPLYFISSSGPIKFEVKDVTPELTFGRAQPPNFENPDCAIIFADTSSRASAKNVPMWFREMEQLNENMPVLLCVNHPASAVQAGNEIKEFELAKRNDWSYFDLCAETGLNMAKPFLWLSQQLYRNPFLVFVVPVQKYTVVNLVFDLNDPATATEIPYISVRNYEQ